MKVKILALLSTLTFSLSVSAGGSLKDYQLVLMNESVSLFDFTMFNMNQNVSVYVAKDAFADLGAGVGVVFKGKLEKLDPEDSYIAHPLVQRSGYVDFAVDEAKFLIVAEGTWTSQYQTNLKPNMNNAAFLCKDMLVKLSVTSDFRPFLHWGYSTENVRKLGDAKQIKEKLRQDMKYIAKVHLGYSWENKPSVECETESEAFIDETFEVDINFKGDWVGYK
ncbi:MULTISPECIES: hypothetical protein [unclassified Alteromonas]|uniref:hypothetical protein n=1 Tax=unclassified Alteromonas TaxID=2614992 RepID=UPI001EF3561A|nr:MULTISPECIES: hypothetical protein [unclassified Alteromonas]MCG7637498.1 hypothetical protein [Alteromonas sp. CNT1-28]MCG7814133.1 hypothetical protein [Alteromonas sp. MCA-1]